MTKDGAQAVLVRIDYDDPPNEVVDKINHALGRVGWSLVDDGEGHDGFIFYRLSEVGDRTDADGRSASVAFSTVKKIVTTVVDGAIRETMFIDDLKDSIADALADVVADRVAERVVRECHVSTQ